MKSGAAGSSFAAAAPLTALITAGEVLAALGQPTMQVIDARAPDRFRGENETLDPVGGHIPGAINRFFRDNLEADGRFKAPAQLRAEWLAAQKRLELARVTFRREQQLWQERISAEQDYLLARNALQEAEINAQSAQSRLAARSVALWAR